MSVDMDMKSQVSAPDDGPKPTHYLARGTDKYTPLIPLDELPDFVKIAGVVVYINQSELLNLHGTGCFPIIPKSSVPYTVDVDNLYRRSDSPDSSFQASMNVPSSRVRDARIAASLRQGKLHGSSAGTAKSNGQVYNPTTPGVLGTKVYCTHWMRTGECDFTQQGCMFLHIMPELDILESLGFRSYPRWFREMPRDFQEGNSKGFDPAGLDYQRGRRAAQETHSFAPKPQHGGYSQFSHPSYGYHPNGPQGYTPSGPPGYPSGYQPHFGGPSPFQEPYAANMPAYSQPQQYTAYPMNQRRNKSHQFGMPFGQPFVPSTPAGPSTTVRTPDSDTVSPSMSTININTSSHNANVPASPQPGLDNKFPTMKPRPAAPQAQNQPQTASRVGPKAPESGRAPSPENRYMRRFTNGRYEKVVAPDHRVMSNNNNNGNGSGNGYAKGKIRPVMPQILKPDARKDGGFRVNKSGKPLSEPIRPSSSSAGKEEAKRDYSDLEDGEILLD